MKESILISGPQRCSLISTDFSVLVDRNVTVGAGERARWVRALGAQADELSSNPHLWVELSVAVCTSKLLPRGGQRDRRIAGAHWPPA